MQAKLDENGVPTILGVACTTDHTTVPVQANPATFSLKVNFGGIPEIDKTFESDPRDENSKVAFMAVSSEDGITPVPVYADPITKSLFLQK